MSNRRYEEAIASVRPELEALLQTDSVEPVAGDEPAEMARWVALCLSALGEVSEESSVNGDDEMARAADSREAMLSAARAALDALHAVCGIGREQALSMLEDVLAAGGALDRVDRNSPPSADAELEAAGLDASHVFHDLRHTFGTRMAAAGVPCGSSRSGWATRTWRRPSATPTTPRVATRPRWWPGHSLGRG